MKSEKVSIVIPVYNVEVYLKKCMESVLNQTYSCIEIILVDDGSTDKSPNICERYMKQDSRVCVIHQKNLGLSAARNRGVEASTGEYIMFVDSDDWIEFNTVELLMEKAKSTGYEIIAHSLYKYNNGVDRLVLPDDIKEYDVNVEKYQEYLYASCLLNQSSFPYLFPQELRCGPEMSYPVLKLFRKDFLKRNNLVFPEGLKFCEDKVFELSVVKAAQNIYYINKPLYHYVTRLGSLTNRHAKEKSNDYIKTFCYLEDKMKELKVPKTIYKYFNLNVLQNCWNIAERFGMECNTIKDVFYVSPQFQYFMDNSYCKTAVAQIDKKMIRSAKHFILTKLLQAKMYTAAVFACFIYYKLNAKKNIFKE